MEQQILALIILLVGFGVMIGGFAFIRRIFAVVSGCLQVLIGLAIAFLVLLLLMQASCNSLVGRLQQRSDFADSPRGARHLVMEGEGTA
ncbi:MAG TPA: hypothetical protein VF701_09130 [Thermoanaerobaculia bacterium]